MSHRTLLCAGVLLVLAVPLALSVLTVSGAPLPEKPAKSPLAVSIAVPINHNVRSINLGGKQAFYVVITNTSDKPVRLWREWCSWGYYNLSFEIDAGDGKVTTIKKKPRGWDKNYPDFQILPAGEHFVIPVTFDAAVWELPFAKANDNKPREVRLRAVYGAQADEQSKEHGVWTGTVRSAYENYAVWGNP